jgi:hypothetical protein
MATTDARPGFKLPWGSDRSETDSTAAEQAAPPGAPEEQPTATVEHADAAPEPVVNETTPQDDPWRLGQQPAAVAEPAAKRKPNKLMADLTRAMQSAAESAREETLGRLQTDAKSYIETVHTRSATEAEQLRQTADSDITGIREWSKAEISRIREETDQKVTDRKARLETEVEQHAARIEARIEQVQNHVAEFESEMAGFFQRLLAEEDPSLLAAMAESLPEPPTFDDFDNLPEPQLPAPVATAVEPEAVAEAVVDEPRTEEWTQAEASVEQPTEAVADSFGEPAAEQASEPADDPEAVFAAIQAAAEAAAAAEATGDTGFAEAQTDEQPVAEADQHAVEAQEPAANDDADPRLAAFGFGTDAPVVVEPWGGTETGQDGDAVAPGEDIPTISDDALAARLAGLVPGEGETVEGDVRTTRVVVTGLVSVASIASFKRSLGKIDGVANVGVSSGPDGEFVFAVSHTSAIDLPGAITSLPDFAAQITSVSDDTVSVAARDPETES